MKRYRVAVVGGGAAGLLAAVTAARALKKQNIPGGVVLLEGNPRPGKKLLATGNGRCNLTNLHISPEHYHGDVEAAAPLLGSYPARRILAKFEELGLLCRADSEGRVYPNSLQAAAVLQTLWSACEEAGVELRWGFAVSQIEKKADHFQLTDTGGKIISAGRCILASGGKASPKHSCQSSGYELAKALGHTVTSLTPALAPLKTSAKLCKALKGVRCKARVSLWEAGKKLGEESGEVIFGDGQISGICVFDLSSLLTAAPAELRLDLLEQWSGEKLFAYWNALKQNRPALPAAQLFSGLLHLRVGQELTKLAGLPGDKKISELHRQDFQKALEAAKDLRLPVTGLGGWESAQVTSGGVPLSELDTGTMGSKRCPGLYLAGELLNINGDCGGYNLHWAWLTAMAAGESAAR